MKALTLTQPWATLIAVGAKRIETRSWSTPFRGRIAIHAAKGLGPVGGKSGLKEQCESPSFAHVLRADFLVGENHIEALPLGVIIATARLSDVRRIDMALRAEVLAQTITPNEIEFGNYESGRYAWFLEDVVALRKPVQCKGALNLWEVPTDVMAQVALNGGF